MATRTIRADEARSGMKVRYEGTKAFRLVDYVHPAGMWVHIAFASGSPSYVKVYPDFELELKEA